MTPQDLLRHNDTGEPWTEPETVFGLRSTPPADASIDALFDAIAWVAPGFEIVQSHLPDLMQAQA